MTSFRLGRHVAISQGFLAAPMYAHEIGCEIFQIFLGAPQQTASKPKPKQDLIDFGKELDEYKLKMVIHGSYTINLCQPKKTKLYQSSIKSLIKDLHASSLIGKNCIGVIIHMGKNVAVNNLSTEQAIQNYVFGLKETIAETPNDTYIILETGASQGTEVASKISGLKEIYWSLDEEEQERIKFCIDTCHIWATGYDISTVNGVNKYFKEFDKSIGIEKIACIHFNDSKTILASHVDRHNDLGYGYIGDDGLKAVALFAKKHNIPLIMETPLDTVNPKTNRDITFLDELKKIKSWVGSN